MKTFPLVQEHIRPLALEIRDHLQRFISSTRPHTLKFEISVLYTTILGVILIGFSCVFYFIIAQTLYQELDEELKLKAEGISQNISSYLNMRGQTFDSLMYAAEQTIAHEDQTLRRWWYIGFERRWFKQIEALDLREEYVSFINSDGQALVHSKKMDETMLKLFHQNVPAVTDQPQFKDVIFQGQRMRVIYWPLLFTDKKKYFIEAGMPVKPIVDLLQGWMRSIILSIPFILLLTSFVGRLLAARILKPVSTIATTAKNITYEDLGERVLSKYYYEEMNYLIDAFNEMIARLEKSFQHIAEFSSHVAHELKTPLTIMRGEAELALMEKRTGEQYRAAIGITLDETTQMLKIVEDLLLLTKLDYQPEVFKFEEIDFNEFITEIFEQGKILAAQKNISLIMDPPATPCSIRADQLHLRRLFFNLLDNALKFTPSGGSVRLTVCKEENTVVASVSDTGGGIAEEHLDKIFERFYRVTSREAGAGLGLNIAQSIAKMHKGFIRVNSRLGEGTTFTVHLPSAV